MKKLSILLLLCLTLTACAAPASPLPDGGSPLPTQEENNEPVAAAESAAPIVHPAPTTDPNAITVDDTLLVRADGQVLDWDAAPIDEAALAAAPTAFDASTWPTDEFVQGLPMPALGKVSMSGASEDAPGTFTIFFEGLPHESFLEYIEALKQAGYTGDAQTQDYAEYGMEGISYAATGADGRRIEAMSVGGTVMLMITK